MFKMSSFWIEHGPDLHGIERQTYSLLDWIGDVGGLLDGLKIVGSFLVAPIAAFSLRSELLSTVFKSAPNYGSVSHLDGQFEKPSYSLIATYLCPCSPKRVRYKKTLLQAEFQFFRQLDVVKFVQRQRMTLLSLMSILRPDQRILVQHVSEMLIKADDEAYVSDLPVDAAKMKAEINLIAMKTKGSKDTTDKRLMHLYWHQNKKGPMSDIQQRPERRPRQRILHRQLWSEFELHNYEMSQPQRQQLDNSF